MDFSNAGKRRRLDGPTMPTTLAFATLVAGSGAGVHENVKSFPNLFETHMTEHRVGKFKVAPRQFGERANFMPVHVCFRLPFASIQQFLC